MVLRPSIFLPAIGFLCWSLCIPSWLWAAEKTAALFQELCSVCHGVGGKGLGVSRRRFFQILAAAGAAAGLSHRLSPKAWAQAAATPVIKPTPKELFNDFGSNKEMRWENLYERGYLVPNDLFFVRNHTRTPSVDVKKWR